jgi:hypothetical protein
MNASRDHRPRLRSRTFVSPVVDDVSQGADVDVRPDDVGREPDTLPVSSDRQVSRVAGPRIHGGQSLVIKAMEEVDQIAAATTAKGADSRKSGRAQTCRSEVSLCSANRGGYGETQPARRGADGLATDRRQDHLVQDASFVDAHRFVEVHEAGRR